MFALTVLQYCVAHRKNNFRRPDDGQEELFPVTVHKRMIFDCRVERQFRDKRRIALDIILTQTKFLRKYKKSCFGRVAGNSPSRELFREQDPRIRGKRSYPCCTRETQMFCSFYSAPGE